jgi:two-component system cell cycle sensor histidine kinase/response regulator CckA
MMHWQYNPYVLPLLIAAALLAVLALVAWRRRPAPGAAVSALLLLAVVIWVLGYTLKLWGADLQSKLFWHKVEYLGVVVVPGAWLALALQHSGWEKRLTRRNVALLATEPLAMLLLLWTNQFHGLFYSNTRLETIGPFTGLIWTCGVGYWVNIAYSYLLILFGTFLLIQALIRSPYLYRRQAIALLIAGLAPWGAEIASTFGLNPLHPVDVTPFAFILTGLAVTWNLFRFQFLDIVPVARDAVIEGMSDGVIVLDSRNRIVDLNPAAGQIIGRPASEAIGQPINIADSSASLTTSLGLRIEGLEVQDFHSGIVRLRLRPELRPRGAHDEVHIPQSAMTFDLRVSPLHDQRGQLTGRLVVLHDITEQVRAEEKLKRISVEQDVLLSTVPAMIFWIDKGGNFIRVNEAFAAALHKSSDDIAGQSLFDLYPENMAKKFHDDNVEVMESGTPKRNIEEPVETPTGIMWVSTDKIPYGNEKGDIVGVVGFSVDITERKRAEEALRRAHDALERRVEERTAELSKSNVLLRQEITERERAEEQLRQYELIVESANDALFIKDLQSRYILVNNRVLELFGGIPREQIVGKTDKELMPLEDALHNIRDDQEVFNTGEQKDFTKKNTIEGEDYWFHATKIPLRDDEGKIIGLVGIARDITERMRMEEELRKAYSDLRDSQAKLIQSEKLAATGRLAASVAHEINNPLQGISNYLAVISHQVAKEDPLHEDLEMVKLGFERISEIVRRLRAFYRPAEEKMEPTDINGVVERVLALVGHQLSLGKVEVKRGLSEQELLVLGSAGQLEQVLVNLVMNAQEAMPQGGQLMMRTALREGVVELQVSDTGPGMSEEEMSRLFKPFYSGRGGKGLGLGLWISHNIIEGHSGHIEMESEVGEGTTFTISLPAYRGER